MNPNNEEVLATFRDWWSQFKSPALSQEKIDDGISAVRVFAESIDPKSLAQSSIVEINAFVRKEVLKRDRRSLLLGMEAFRSFRESVLNPKKTPRPGPPR
jgi:hypothetical protein